MTTSIVVALVHAAASLFLVGTIWTIQVVHYPLFAAVGSGSFADYEAGHTARITRLLALPWGLQGLTTLVLLASPPPGVPALLVWVAAVVVAVPVAVTLGFSLPAHAALGGGFASTTTVVWSGPTGCARPRGPSMARWRCGSCWRRPRGPDPARRSRRPAAASRPR